jgi:Phosphate-selective porin O and P
VIRRRFVPLLGFLLVSAGSATASAQPAPAAGGTESLVKQIEAQQADIDEQGNRIKDLEKKLSEVLANQRKQAEKAAPAPPPPPPPPPAPLPEPPPSRLESILPEIFRNLTISGYVQAQYEAHQDSQDQLDPSGNPLNKDRFVLRRARLKVEKEWQYASSMFEIDGNTVNGPAISLWHAEASLLYRGDRPFTLPPFVKLTFGIFDTPFGYELVEGPKTRWFMERSQMSRAIWPGEPDLGARLTSALGWFRGSVAILNGNPAGLATGFPLRDPASAKDIAARGGFELTPTPPLFLAGGVSVYNGKGFHAGTTPGKTTLQYTDMYGDGLVDPGDLTVVTATSASPSSTFDRWAVAADARAEYRSFLGLTRLTFEVMLASNMDRTLYIADPVLLGRDLRELGYSIGVTQEIFSYGIVGFRYDSYDPDSDAFATIGGRVLPSSETIRTYSPLIGVALPDHARLLFEYDVIRNELGRTATGLPTDLRDDTWTLRLQVKL